MVHPLPYKHYLVLHTQFTTLTLLSVPLVTSLFFLLMASSNVKRKIPKMWGEEKKIHKSIIISLWLNSLLKNGKMQ